MKRFILMATGLLLVASAFAAKIGSKKQIGNIEYKILTETTVGVSLIFDKQSVIVIPETVNIDGYNYVVTEVLPKSNSKGAKKITSVELPKTIQAIGEYAFVNFLTLNTINIPQGVTSIGVGAFARCTDLRNIELPLNLKIIKADTFKGSSLLEITIPYYVNEIEKGAFASCEHLSKVTITGPQIFLGDKAFAKCEKLKEVYLPELLSDKDKKKVFGETEDIRFILTEQTAAPVLPTPIDIDAISAAENQANSSNTASNVVSNYANGNQTTSTSNSTVSKADNTNLRRGKALKTGSKKTVDGIEYQITSSTTCTCNNLKDAGRLDVVIPAIVNIEGGDYMVTAIGNDAMHKKNNLMSYTLYTGFSFLRGNFKARSVEIPNTVTSIGEKAFAGCSMLQEINIPESVTEIGEKAFENCMSLSSIIIPESVKSIGKDAFKGCEYLLAISKPAHISERIFPDNRGIKFFDVNATNTELFAQQKQQSAQSLETFRSEMIAKEEKFQQQQQPRQQQVQPQQQYTAVAGTATPTASTVKPAQTVAASDVDINIPKASKTNEKTFVVLIANENYITEVPVKYAINDGTTMKRYMIDALGIPESNVRLVTDATRNQVLMQIDWLKNVSAAYDGNLNVIFYYAGHGMPDEATNNAHLIPTDGSSTNPRTCIALSDLYKDLGAINAKNITVMMDACFSGAQRGNGMLMAARGVSIKSKPAAPKGKMIVLSATQEDETAYPYTEKGHGLFTYYILKKLQESGGKTTMGELSDYVSSNVKRRSIVVNNKPQTPNTLVSSSINNIWRSMPFGVN